MEIFMGLRDAKTTPRNPSGWFYSCSFHRPWRSYTLHMVGKIGQYDLGRIIRLCKNLLSIKDKLAALVQNVRRNRPCDLIRQSFGCDEKSNACKAKFIKRVSHFLLANLMPLSSLLLRCRIW